MVEELQHLDRFPDLLARCQALRFEVDADSGLFTIDEKHADAVRQLLSDVVVFLGEVERQYGSARGSDGEGRALVSCSIADLAFLGKMELDGISTSFEEARERKRVWDVLRYADMGSARAEQALIALEVSIREAEGLRARQHDDLELAPALEVRRQYALLRYEMSKAGQPEGAALRDALYAVLTLITRFRDHENYALVRVDDRLQIRSLQKRIHGVLAGNDESAERLWEDLEGSFQLLLQINRRGVLVDHDGRMLGALGKQEVAPRYLSSLLGRSLELDRFILGDGEPSAGEIDRLLDDLREHLLD